MATAGLLFKPAPVAKTRRFGRASAKDVRGTCRELGWYANHVGGDASLWLPRDYYSSGLPWLNPEDADGQAPKTSAAPAANLAGTQTMSAAMRLYGYRGIIIQAD